MAVLASASAHRDTVVDVFGMAQPPHRARGLDRGASSWGTNTNLTGSSKASGCEQEPSAEYTSTQESPGGLRLSLHDVCLFSSCFWLLCPGSLFYETP